MSVEENGLESEIEPRMTATVISLSIPPGHIVTGVYCDHEQPYCIVCPGDGDMQPRTRLLIPVELAEYLRSTWCGSRKMHKMISDDARREVQNKIKDALGIE